MLVIIMLHIVNPAICVLIADIIYLGRNESCVVL